MPKKNIKTRREILKEKVKTSTEKFNREFRKSLVTAITAAFGFLIALVWKDVITEYVNLVTKISPVQSQLISAMIVTLVCVLGILIISKLSVEENL